MDIHVSHNGQLLGPYSLAEINARLAQGALSLSSQVWNEGSSSWIPLRRVPGVDTTPFQPSAAQRATTAANAARLRREGLELASAVRADREVLARRERNDRAVNRCAAAVVGIFALLGVALLAGQRSENRPWVVVCLVPIVALAALAIVSGARIEGTTTGESYAGFWVRFAAYLVDCLILYVPHLIVVSPLVRYLQLHAILEVPQRVLNLSVITAEVIAADAALYWLYFSIAEASAWQATPGKRLLGLKVTDLNGRPISFGLASGRFFAKLVSALPLGLGCVMAAFTARKQALHDLMAGTLVVKSDAGKPTM